MTEREARAMQTMFFTHPAGRILARELREIGHLDTTIDDETARIEHNTVKKVLMLLGCNLQVAREPIPRTEKSTGTEQDIALGVPNDAGTEPQS
jgi:hypothetical protein